MNEGRLGGRSLRLNGAFARSLSGFVDNDLAHLDSIGFPENATLDAHKARLLAYKDIIDLCNLRKNEDAFTFSHLAFLTFNKDHLSLLEIRSRNMRFFFVEMSDGTLEFVSASCI